MSVPSDREAGGPKGRVRVLLVDDNATSVRLLQRLLTGHGLEVAAATDALAAVQRARAESFDVMIVDLRMRPFSGLEVLRRTRELVPMRYVLTGYADAREEAEALALGALAVLHKPLDADEIADLILRADATPAPSETA